MVVGAGTMVSVLYGMICNGLRNGVPYWHGGKAPHERNGKTMNTLKKQAKDHLAELVDMMAELRGEMIAANQDGDYFEASVVADEVAGLAAELSNLLRTINKAGNK